MTLLVVKFILTLNMTKARELSLRNAAIKEIGMNLITPRLRFPSPMWLACLMWIALVSVPRITLAHCDTLEGPVVSAAREALETGKVEPVLPWVEPSHEQTVRDAFGQTLAVRALTPEARTLADRFFFETVVRLHREGEGFPYTGLAPAGTPVEPIIAMADRAIDSGATDGLVESLEAALANGVRQRLATVREAKVHARESVAAGREYVAAYVEFTHYVEALDAAAVGHGGGREDSGEPGDSHLHD
ncbi:MAG: hypothetical protein IPJ17_00370 [Holophagales bacterium]|nr:MAG: hypothetical protein IPJ17_00370 [Holophagales bacterium]